MSQVQRFIAETRTSSSGLLQSMLSVTSECVDQLHHQLLYSRKPFQTLHSLLQTSVSETF